MHVGKLVFAQLMDHLPWKNFGRIVVRYCGDHRVRDFSCANQFRCIDLPPTDHASATARLGQGR